MKTIQILTFIIAVLILSQVTGFTDYMAYQINYAIDYELGIAHLCNGTDYAYDVLGCKYDYSEKFN